MQRTHSNLTMNASRLLGAFFFVLVATLVACSEKKIATEKWQNISAEDPGIATSEKSSVETPTPQRSSAASLPGETEKPRATRFLAYNLKNYLSMRRYINGTAILKSKPAEEVEALISIISSAKPDILGVCEIGTEADLKDLQARLNAAGVKLTYSHRGHGSDPTRALAILSRYPIIQTDIPKQLNYTINATPFAISRGILDTTIQLPNRNVRFLGVHFKSKRPSKEADQSLMRRSESLLLRKHIDDILTADPTTQLLAYGDFNDTKRSKTLSSARGRSNSPLHMKMIELTDSRKENWTHHWEREGIYSRIDYIMANPNLAPSINVKDSKLLDPLNWQVASDHRPMLVIIK